jgi:hypothetical protein
MSDALCELLRLDNPEKKDRDNPIRPVLPLQTVIQPISSQESKQRIQKAHDCFNAQSIKKNRQETLDNKFSFREVPPAFVEWTSVNGVACHPAVCSATAN